MRFKSYTNVYNTKQGKLTCEALNPNCFSITLTNKQDRVILYKGYTDENKFRAQIKLALNPKPRKVQAPTNKKKYNQLR